MRNLQMVKSQQFGTVTCDVYRDEKDFWMTREQVGTALEYADPQKAVDNLHRRNAERLDRLSVTLRLRAADGKEYPTRLYSARGIYEICRWSRQPKADAFYDWVYDLLEGLRKGEVAAVATVDLSPELQMFNQLFQALARQELHQKLAEQKINQLEAGQEHIKDTIAFRPDNWRDDMNRLFNRIVEHHGREKFAVIRRETYKRLEERARVDLDRRLQNLKGRLALEGATKTAIDKANRMDVIETDPKLREIYAIILKELAIKEAI